jgi:hypothetical protein
MRTGKHARVLAVAATLAAVMVMDVSAQGPGVPGPGSVSAEVAGHLKKAQELVAKADAAGAEAALRAAVAVDSTREGKRALADFLMNRPLSAESVKEVLGLLKELSEDPGKAGADALVVGLMRRLVPGAEAAGWLERLRGHPGVTPLMLLAGDRTELQLRPEAKVEIAGKTAKRVAGGAVEDREDAVRWLAEIGEFKLALPLLSREEALMDAGKFGAWTGPRMATDDWQAMLEVLAMPKVPVPEAVQKLLRGRAMIGTGKVEEGRVLCGEACADAKVKPAELAELLALLASLRVPEVFEAELVKALAEPGAAEAVLKAVVPVVRRGRDGKALHHLYELAVASPVLGKNPEVLAKHAQSRMMLGMAEPVAVLEQRMDEAPLQSGPRISYALGLLKEGKGEQALREMQMRKPALDESKLEPSQLVVICGVFAAAGHSEDAMALGGRIPMAALTVEETEWLRAELGKAGAAGAVAAPAAPAVSGWQRSVARYGFDLLLVAGVYVLWLIWQKFIRKSA